jgi:hypothetical protein
VRERGGGGGIVVLVVVVEDVDGLEIVVSEVEEEVCEETGVEGNEGINRARSAEVAA